MLIPLIKLILELIDSKANEAIVERLVIKKYNVSFQNQIMIKTNLVEIILTNATVIVNMIEEINLLKINGTSVVRNLA